MTKRLVHSLEGYVNAVFTDLLPTYRSAHDWERDKNRSLHELAYRGERLLTIDWPALRKHFEKCLEDGLYSSSKLFLSRNKSKRVQVPAFLSDLYLQVFDAQGKLLPEPNVCAIADLRQLYEGFGKLKHPCKQEAIDEEVSNFYTIEASLRNPTLFWEGDELYEDHHLLDSVSFHDGFNHHGRAAEGFLPFIVVDESQLQSGDITTLERVCDVIASSFGDLHLERDDELVSERPQHGTGRVSNQKKTESKYDFAIWPRKLDLIFPFDRYAVHDLGLGSMSDDLLSLDYRNFEHPSKLCAVPKTMSGPRLIGSEPNYHQWIQQLIRSQIEARIANTPLCHCVSFGNQEPNRLLALKGSFDGSIATVDLKSASDRLSCWTVERAFRRNLTFLQRIHASRTRTMRNAINDTWSVIKLKKCFTQGSACTFPVQTIVYSMIAIAAVLLSDGLRPTSSNILEAARKVRVFGDDIIIPVNALQKLTELLSFNQLVVNSGKTFSKGKFRESCGLDAYDGVDVTPARIKRFSESPSHEIAQSMLESCNNLYKRGMWHTAYWLRSYLSRFELPDRKITRPEWDLEQFRDSDGFASFISDRFDHLVKRYNRSIQTEEYRIHYLTSNSKKVPTQSAHDLYEFLHRAKLKIELNPHLNPKKGGLGIVNKKSSVMKTGWKTLFHKQVFNRA